MQLKALLLDLDGTLVDTAPDMVATLNRMLLKRNLSNVDQKLAAKQVSNGAKGLIEMAFGKQSPENLERLRSEFLADYETNICVDSKLFDEMANVLELCEENQIHWGIVTNKPFLLSKRLLDELGIHKRCRILVGGDSLPVSKPDPAPLLHCTLELSLAASECLYVGDHERDIIAGRAAGMDTAAALWGYIENPEKADDWGANYLVNKPSGLLKLIQDKLEMVKS